MNGKNSYFFHNVNLVLSYLQIIISKEKFKSLKICLKKILATYL